MKAIWLFARITIREAVRKRLMWVLMVLTLVVIAGTAFGFSRLWDVTEAGTERLITSSILLILVMFAYSFVLSLSAVFMMAPSVAGELESGTALAILTRPVSRAQLLLGKWLGLAMLVAAYVAVASWTEFLIVSLVTDYSPPHPIAFVAYMVSEALILLTLSMAISTRLQPVAGGVIALGAFMVAWLGGVAISVGRELGIDGLVTSGTLTSLLLPSEGLWKGAVYSLEPSAMIAMAVAQGRNGIANFPFFALNPPSVSFRLWAVFWVAGVIGLAIWSLNKREI